MLQSLGPTYVWKVENNDPMTNSEEEDPKSALDQHDSRPICLLKAITYAVQQSAKKWSIL